MTRPGIGKVLTVTIALSGFGLAGAGTALAQVAPQPTNTGIVVASVTTPQTSATNSDSNLRLGGGKIASSSQTQTRGSTEIFTSPNAAAGSSAGPYGPFFHQNRGLGGAVAIAAAAGRGR